MPVYEYTLCLTLLFVGIPYIGGVPQWREGPVNTTAIVGENVTLNCSLDGLNENGPYVRWSYWNGQETKQITTDTETHNSCCEVYGDSTKGEYNLLIKGVQLEHEGVWKCSLINANPQTKEATLSVKEKDEDPGKDESGSHVISPRLILTITSAITTFSLLGLMMK